jgi:hypothetical protein
MVIKLAEKMGFRNYARYAAFESGIPENRHYNAVVEVNGIPYICETSFEGRHWYARPYPDGIMYSQLSDSEVSYNEYLGFDTSVVIPAVIDGFRVVSIGDNAFARKNVVKITLAEGITKLGYLSLYSAEELVELVLPSTLSEIEPFSFSGAIKLKTVNISKNNPYMKFQDGMVLSKDGTRVIIAAPAAMKGSIIIPHSVTTINEDAFGYCLDMFSVTIPGSVSVVPMGAFFRCERLRSIILEEGITEIHDHAFEGSNAYRSHDFYKNTIIRIPKTVSVIEPEALDISANVTIIGERGSYAETYANNNGLVFAEANNGAENVIPSVTVSIDNVVAMAGDKVYVSMVLSGNPNIAFAEAEFIDFAVENSIYIMGCVPEEEWNPMWGSYESGNGSGVGFYDNRSGGTINGVKLFLVFNIARNVEVGTYKIEPDYFWAMTADGTYLELKTVNPGTITIVDKATLFNGASSWAVESIKDATLRGLATNELITDFQSPTTRAEFCRAAIHFLIKCGYDIDSVTPKLFSDTSDREIGIAAALGITSGTDTVKNLFSPDSTLTREQAAGMLRNVLRVIEADVKSYGIEWIDSNDISNWAKEPIDVMYSIGIMSGTSTAGNIFSPQRPYTHEQSILTLLSMWYYLK